MAFRIKDRWIGYGYPTYFIAEIGANHDGSIDRAKKLIELAKESGADCAKFQHYSADTLASRRGFEGLDLAHYKENPYDVFKKYEVPLSWTPTLKEHCDKVGIHFMTTPYDIEQIDYLDMFVDAFKIGSGDITYHQLISAVNGKRKPVFLSTGASNADDVDKALWHIDADLPLVLMQCNTNYEPDSDENLRHLNLSVLEYYMTEYNCEIGLSDHTDGDMQITAAVALGACAVERHFTDKQSDSPDDPFACSPDSFSDAVAAARVAEMLLGAGVKQVEANEQETVVLQRRCIRVNTDLPAGTLVEERYLTYLRPAPADSLPPYEMEGLLGKRLRNGILEGDYIRETDLL